MLERQLYKQCYVERYIVNTLESPYTRYKNEKIAEEVCRNSIPSCVVDIGGNVNGTVISPSSLRYQLELRGCKKYVGLDLSLACFRPTDGFQQDGIEIYSKINGIVGDVARLPFSNQSIECIVCADVLEHVPNPRQALMEIGRVIRDDGYAVVVLPSMYKLDCIGYEYIAKIRYSTHCNKLGLVDWLKLCQDAGLTYTERSRPLGIMSGLSYLMWLNEDFVPRKQSPYSESVYSPNAKLHKDIKEALSAIDPIVDEYYQKYPDQLSLLVELLLSGKIGELFECLQRTASIFIKGEDLKMIKKITEFNFDLIPRERVELLVEKVRQLSTLPNNMFLGNSALLVLRKAQ